MESPEPTADDPYEGDHIEWDPDGRLGWWFSKRMIFGMIVGFFLVVTPITVAVGGSLGLLTGVLTLFAVLGAGKTAQTHPEHPVGNAVENFTSLPLGVHVLAVLWFISSGATHPSLARTFGRLAGAYIFSIAIVQGILWTKSRFSGDGHGENRQ